MRVVYNKNLFLCNITAHIFYNVTEVHEEGS